MAAIYSDIARRGVQAMSAVNPDSEYIEHLKHQARQYNRVTSEITPVEWLTLIFTGIAFMLLFISVKYTLGEVVNTIAMVEQPGATATLSTSDDPDAPLEKEIQIEIVKQKPITSSIRKTVAHLTHLGGFAARWRGLSVFILYHMAHAFTANLIFSVIHARVFLGGPLGSILMSTVATILLSRIHMTLTHVIVSLPSTLPWYKRIPRGNFYFKTLALPSFVLAISEHLLVVLPALVFLCFGGLPSAEEANVLREVTRVTASLLTALLVAVALVLPAAVTLTRIEASLLPDDQETVVNFDRTLGGAAISAISLAPNSIRTLFVAAWKTFDRASRLRLIKLYIKTFMIKTMVVFAFFFVVSIELFSFGPDRLITLIKAMSARAQLESMGIDY